jgi:hypothetical protein
MQLELNWIETKLSIESNFNSIPISKWIPIQFLLNSTIGLKLKNIWENRMQIDEKDIKILFMNMVLEKKTLLKKKNTNLTMFN